MMLMYTGIVFSFVFGVLLHYVFEWSGRSLFVAFIAPTNESLFEHLKLLLSPYLIWTLVEYAHYGQFMHAFVPAKVISLYIGMFLMISFYLFYTWLADTQAAWMKVLIFGMSVVAAFVSGEFLMTFQFMDRLGLEIFFDAVLVLTVIVFAACSIYPPNKGFFKPTKR